VTGNLARGGLIGLIGSLLLTLPVAAGPATPPPPPPPAPPATTAPDTVQEDPTSLIPVPLGCPTPDPAAVAFVGTMIGKDDVTQTVRFRIDQLRAGSAAPWAIDGLIDVRYGSDYRFLRADEQYLVGAARDPEYGVLSSRVRPVEPLFGGNAVIGVDDTAVECPIIDDPVQTLHVDGTSVDSGVLTLLFEDRRLLLATLAVPVALAAAALLSFAMLKLLAVLAAKGVMGLGRAAVTPVPDQRAVRVRTHRSGDGELTAADVAESAG
jgi:hypothetical protein